MKKSITNINIKQIISAISSNIENFFNYNNIDLIHKFIDNKEFNERENKFISMNLYSKDTNYLLLIEENSDLNYSLSLQKLDHIGNKIYLYYTENGLNLSLNNVYWEDENSFSLEEVFEFLFKKNDLLNLYARQKDIIVSFQYFIDNIDSYKKINKITEY